jgi:hypothetical protein
VFGAEAFGGGGGLAVLDGALGHIGRITDFGSIGKEIVRAWARGIFQKIWKNDFRVIGKRGNVEWFRGVATWGSH